MPITPSDYPLEKPGFGRLKSTEDLVMVGMVALLQTYSAVD
jgi:hypothetical protein